MYMVGFSRTEIGCIFDPTVPKKGIKNVYDSDKEAYFFKSQIYKSESTPENKATLQGRR